MKADIIKIGENDVAMIQYNVENLPPEEVDKYIEKMMAPLVQVFGTGHVVVMPVREGPTWDVTIVRKSCENIKKVVKEQQV